MWEKKLKTGFYIILTLAIFSPTLINSNIISNKLYLLNEHIFFLCLPTDYYIRKFNIFLNYVYFFSFSCCQPICTYLLKNFFLSDNSDIGKKKKRTGWSAWSFIVIYLVRHESKIWFFFLISETLTSGNHIIYLCLRFRLTVLVMKIRWYIVLLIKQDAFCSVI